MLFKNHKFTYSNQLFGVPDALQPFMLANHIMAQDKGRKKAVFIARDDARLADIETGLRQLMPDLNIISLPAWDCLPYDRVSPHSDITAQRIYALSSLARLNPADEAVLLTTVNGWLQKVPPPAFFEKNQMLIKVGATLTPAELASYLSDHGYLRCDTVREVGEFAVRGGIVDVFTPPYTEPFRIDFFGDEIESLKPFDPVNQRSLPDAASHQQQLLLLPSSEYRLDDQTISHFRAGYIEAFGAKAARDALYEAVSAGQTQPGLEHWLALLHSTLLPLGDYLADFLAMPASAAEQAHIFLDDQGLAAAQARLEQISEFYTARAEFGQADGLAAEDMTYRPVPAEAQYLTDLTSLDTSSVIQLQSFAANSSDQLSFGGGAVPNFSAQAAAGSLPATDLARNAIEQARKQGKAVLLSAASQGALSRLVERIFDKDVRPATFDDITALEAGQLYQGVLPNGAAGTGAQTDHFMLITETDLFGVQASRPARKRKRGEDFLREVASLETGDLVVHVEHGIGRYDGLETVSSGGGQHDCLRLIYSGGDRLFLPVENIELLSRYGQEGSDASLDKLGGVAWQARRARIKGRIKEMADQLMQIAAKRSLAKAEVLNPPEGLFEEFCARFGHSETEDQLEAVADVLGDLGSGTASDRLICGDVGFGKTEVALRAAFVAAMAGYQVALVTPTTLLARQHGKLFANRFSGFPVKVATLSRMTTSADAKTIKEEITSGEVQVVIGTHALLAKSISFNHLGLLIVDEEQNFGVAQKERLKELRGDVHVLTLSATPIPRTLQMALSGVRQMSLITTPPVDRLAVRSFVGPWDGVVLREALRREIFRGGQSFVVCPRIKDLPSVFDKITALVPEAKILTAHGQMPPAELDKVMTDFGDGKADILLSTNIVESGIDIPTANTMIIHRADRFGLAQLYQLRGRVGRGKQRAYAYLTTDPHMLLTPQAKKRLEVMQTLDKLGAGFSLASYDMDIRGAGNLLGDEQSGHVKEVGIELYQDMLRQAVELARHQGKTEPGDSPEIEVSWSPQINLGQTVMIPADYVTDLTVRLSLYRRIAELPDTDAIEQVKIELIDRFGALPDSLNNLLQTVELKQLCRKANIQKIEAGPKGFVVSLKDGAFPQPDKLVGWIAAQKGQVVIKPDQRLVVKQDLTKLAVRAKAAQKILNQLADLAA